jgi:hypothetical protein
MERGTRMEKDGGRMKWESEAPAELPTHGLRRSVALPTNELIGLS